MILKLNEKIICLVAENESLELQLSKYICEKDKRSIKENVSQKELDLQQTMNIQFENLEEKNLNEGKEISKKNDNIYQKNDLDRRFKDTSAYLNEINMIDKEIQCELKNSDISTQTDSLITCGKEVSANITPKITIDQINQTENQISDSEVSREFESENNDGPKA